MRQVVKAVLLFGMIIALVVMMLVWLIGNFWAPKRVSIPRVGLELCDVLTNGQHCVWLIWLDDPNDDSVIEKCIFSGGRLRSVAAWRLDPEPKEFNILLSESDGLLIGEREKGGKWRLTWLPVKGNRAKSIEVTLPLMRRIAISPGGKWLAVVRRVTPTSPFGKPKVSETISVIRMSWRAKELTIAEQERIMGRCVGWKNQDELVFIQSKGMLSIYNVVRAKVRTLNLSPPVNLERIMIARMIPSPDERYIACDAGMEIYIVDTNSGVVKKLPLSKRMRWASLSFLGWSGPNLIAVEMLASGQFRLRLWGLRVLVSQAPFEAYTAHEFQLTDEYSQDVFPPVRYHPLRVNEAIWVIWRAIKGRGTRRARSIPVIGRVTNEGLRDVQECELER